MVKNRRLWDDVQNAQNQGKTRTILAQHIFTHTTTTLDFSYAKKAKKEIR